MDHGQPTRHSRRLSWTQRLPLETETCLFILANTLDVFMTYILLTNEDFREANFLANFFLNEFSFAGMVYYKFLLVAIVTVVTQLIATRSIRTARWVLNIGSAFIFIVVLYSAVLLVFFSGLVF